ncbi:MAG: outer membrane protein assembly factor BamA [Chthoniobacterales bacterium]
MGGAFLTVVALFGLWGKPPPPVGDVRFEGNHSFSAPQLVAILRNRYYVTLGDDFDVTEADDAAYFLREFYFSRGFREAHVAYTFTPRHPPSVLFAIDEGAQDFIGNVTFEGESILPPPRLREIFDAAVRQATLRPFGRMRYVESAVEAGGAAIVTALAQKGYLLAEADVSDPSEAVKGLVNLTVTIRQGVRYFVREVSFAGSPLDDATLRGVLAEYLNQPYQRNQESLMRTRVQDWLRNHGYATAEVTTTAALDAVTGKVDVAFDVNAGRTYKVGAIRVEGVQHTKDEDIRTRFAVKPGDLYNSSAVDEGARRLWFSGAFSEADVERIPNPDGTVDLVLKLKETRAKRIQFGVGYSQWDRGFAEVHYIDRNFAGTLNRFSVDASISQRSYGFSAALTDPWVFGTDYEGSVGVSYAKREQPAYSGIEYGSTLSLVRNFESTNLTGYRIQYGWKRVTDAVIFGDDPDDPDPNYTLGSISFSQTYDTRNNILSPMKGYYLNYEAELASQALLGDVSFARFSAQFTYYKPLREITTEHPFVPFVVFNHRAGVLLPYGDTSVVPVQERFFLGGPDTVRSFQLDGLGPKDSGGDPIGGLAMLLFNLEVQWPVFNNIYVAAFADAGNLWSATSDIQPTDLQVGVGPGLRVYTPLGAIRIDYGYNLNRTQGDPIGAWQVGFGFTF